MIPKILHRCAFGSVPDKFEGFWQEWGEMHPDWQLMSWEGPLRPSEWRLGHQFTRVHSFSELADMVSAEVVWKYGGVYVDWDTQCLKPLDPLLDIADCWFGSEGGSWLSHGIFAATAEHPAMDAVVEAMAAVEFTKDPNETTGPHLLTRVLSGQVHVPPKDWFYPINVDDYAPWSGASGPDIAHHFPQAYTIHHWAHSWKDHKSGRMSAYNSQTLEDMLDVG